MHQAEILVQVPFVAKRYGDIMKKILSIFFVLILFFGFVPYVVNAEEAQQEEDTISVTVKSYFDSENIITNTVSNKTYGSKLTMNSNLADDADYDFAYWIVNGVVRNDLPVDYTFTMTYDLELIGVFYPTNPVEYLVMFMDTNGHSIDWEYVSSGMSATAPESLPSKPGYVVDDVTPWSEAYSNVTANVVTVLQYEKDNSDTHLLTVIGGSLDTGQPVDGVYDYNEVATVVADAPEAGEYFHHWETEDRVVSYQSTYSFTMLDDLTLTAVYSTSAVADKPSITVSHDLDLRDGYHSYLGQFYLPSGYELVEFGVLTSTNSEYLDLGSDNVIRNKGEKYIGSTNEFVISVQDANAVSRRGYLIVKDSLGELVTVYDEAAYSVVNGGFETGDLTGWNSYNIWKDESGMVSFIDSRVVNDDYFGENNTYDRDGSYNLGLAEDTIGWDQVSERMGHLRSSNFTLGGSGYISFKLGGGKTSSIAYISVRRTTDNVEIARFGNEHFNDTSMASTQYGSAISNAEAYLFQYYFDLSSVGTMGESYYITITEAAAYDWAILSVDSVVTYYKEAPTTSVDTLATNIVPTIQGVETASNAIVDGYFDNDFDYWTNVDGSWYVDGGKAKSNPNGDSDLGVLRSSAFTIDGTGQYLRFDWAGGMKYDKQIFISIKEVGTNIEVLRFVRRDNLSGHEGTGYDNHMLDLSGLDTTKQYYIEFADNRTGGYGISYVDHIRLVDLAEWDSVTSGDRAVSVVPLETEYIYIYE